MFPRLGTSGEVLTNDGLLLFLGLDVEAAIADSLSEVLVPPKLELHLIIKKNHDYFLPIFECMCLY